MNKRTVKATITLGLIATTLIAGGFLIFGSIVNHETKPVHLDQNKVWELTNAENADTPVLKDPKLCEYARLRVDGFWKAAGNGGLDYLNHEGFSATNQEFMLENGFARVGEIIVKTDYDDNGTTDYNKKVVKMWMDSPTHKAIITDDTHTRGCIECEGNHCVGIYGETVDEWYQRQEGLR